MDFTIIPAIDIIDGQCVRLTQGDYDRQTIYYRDPLDAAKAFADCGATRLHMVDLDGAKASQPRNLASLERVASNTALTLQFGGGIINTEALESVYSAGASMAICGSIAVKDPELFASWLEKYGSDRLILGADISNGKVAVHGWTETSPLSAEQLIEKFVHAGLSKVICTDISRDGMLCGPAIDLYTGLQKRFPGIEITVSGGISSVDDIYRIKQKGLRSVITGKALYEGRITLNDLKQCLQNE